MIAEKNTDRNKNSEKVNTLSKGILKPAALTSYMLNRIKAYNEFV